MKLSNFLKTSRMSGGVSRAHAWFIAALQSAVARGPLSSLLFVLLVSSLAGYSQSDATHVVITTQPVPGVNGGLMTVQPVVEIRNALDQLVTNSTAQLDIVLASGAGGSIGGTTRIHAVNGVGTFTDLTLSGLANEAYTFQVKSEPVIVSEPFNYPAGVPITGNNGGTGWNGAWFGAHSSFADLTVSAAGFTYTDFSTSGGRVAYSSGTGGDGGRALSGVSNATADVIWLAFLGNYTQQGGGSNNLRLVLNATVTGGIGGNDSYTNWSILDNTLRSTIFTSALLNGTTRLALLKIDYTAGTSALWMDPVVNSFDGSLTPSMTVNFAPVFDQIHLFNKFGGVGTDEITLASTYKAALHLEQNLIADISLSATLPVKWLHFSTSCKRDHTLLTWGTVNETGNSHFIVERSGDGRSWAAIGTVPGAGTSSVEQSYQFADSTALSNTYYRLRQVDVDGRAALSKTVSAHCENNNPEILHVFPNPARTGFQFSGGRAGRQYELMDASGRVVQIGTIQSGTTTVSLANLPNGSFFLRIAGQHFPSRHILKVGR